MFLNKLLYTTIFRETRENAVNHLFHAITHREIGLDEGPMYYIDNIRQLLIDENAFKEAVKRSVVRPGFPVEELRELLQELSQELSRNYDEPSCNS